MTLPAIANANQRPVNWRATFLRRHLAELLEFADPPTAVYRPGNDVLALKDLRQDLEAAWRRQHRRGGDFEEFRQRLDELAWLRIQKFFAADWSDTKVYLDVPVQDQRTRTTYDSLTDLVVKTNYPGILLRTRSGAGKTVACRRLVYDCFHASRRTQPGNTIDRPNLFGRLPVWLDFSRVPKWEATLADCDHRGRLDEFLPKVLRSISATPQLTARQLDRYLRQDCGPPLLLVCDLNPIRLEHRHLIATAFNLFVRDHAPSGHRCIITYRPLQAEDPVKTNLGPQFERAELLPLSPVLAGQYLISIQRYRLEAAREAAVMLPALDDAQLDRYGARAVSILTRYARPIVRQRVTNGAPMDELPDDGPLISTPLLMHFLSQISPEQLLAEIPPDQTPQIASISDIYAEIVRRAIERDREQTPVGRYFPDERGSQELRMACARLAARMVGEGNVRLSLLAARGALMQPIGVAKDWWPLKKSARCSEIWSSENRHRTFQLSDTEALQQLFGCSLLRVIGDGVEAELAFAHDSFRDYFAGAVLLGEFAGPHDPPPARGPQGLPGDRVVPFDVYAAVTEFACSDPEAARNVLAFFGGTLQRLEFLEFTKALLAMHSDRAWVALFWHLVQSRPLVRNPIMDEIARSIQRRNVQVLRDQPERLLEYLIEDVTGDRSTLFEI